MKSVIGETPETRMLGWALAYATRGFSVLPLWWIRKDGRCACGVSSDAPKHKAGKHPLGKVVPNGSTDATRDESTIRDWWTRYPLANIGICMGEIATGEKVLAVDIDPRSNGPIAWYEYVNGRELPMSVESRSGSGGSHLLFSVPPDEVFPLKFLHGVEVLGNNGRYIVAPPSNHISGEEYRWIVSPLESGFAAAPPWLLRDTRERVRSAANDAREYADSGQKYGDGFRNAHLLSCRGAMMRWGMAREAVFEALKIENQNRCDPPLHESRVREIAFSSDSTSKAQHVVEEEKAPSKYPEGHPLHLAPLLAADAIVGAAKIREIAAKPIPYIWQDIATAAQIVGLNGKPGGGKTTLAFLIVAARANLEIPPIEILGRYMYPAPEEKWILLLEAEQSEGSTSRKLERSFEALGLGDKSLDRVIVLARKEVIVGSEKWKEVQSIVKTGLISDVVIDTLARVAPSEANEEKDQAAVFSAFQAVIESLPNTEEADKPVFWIVMHARKGEEATSVDAVSGSAQRVAQLDTLLNVVPEVDGGRVVASNVYFPKLREDPDDPPAPYRLVVKRDGKRLRITSGVQVIGTPRERVMLVLKMHGELTKTGIKEKTKLNTEQIEEVITALFKDRLLTKSEKDVRGRMRDFFKLRQHGPDSINGHSPDMGSTDIHRTMSNDIGET